MATEAEKEAALVAAQIDWDRQVIIDTDLIHVFGLIGLVQLALRYPGLLQKSASAKMTEKFILKLIEEVDPDHGEVWKLLNRGFNPNWDV